MLTSFSVKNFRSFKDTATLRMVPENLDENNHHLIQNEKMNAPCLPVAVIYGPNGGGKSNNLRALKALVSFLALPIIAVQNDFDSNEYTNSCRINNYKIDELRERIVPFSFQKPGIEEPTEFELIFDGKLAQYKYYLKVLDSIILDEKLEQYKYETRRFSLVFERQGANIKKGRDVSSIPLPRELSSSLSFLSYIAISGNQNPIIDDVVFWLTSNIEFINFGCIENEELSPSPHTLKSFADDRTVDKTATMLDELDLGIAGIRIDRRNPDYPQIYLKHKAGEDIYELNLTDESKGIHKLFTLIPPIISALEHGSILIIDEMDANIHPRILEHLAWLFTSSSQNQKGAQLIFTSNDLTSMTSGSFRKDEIWFAAKNCMQESQLYSLSDFRDENGKPVSTDEPYFQQYMEGRFGADPFIQKLDRSSSYLSC